MDKDKYIDKLLDKRYKISEAIGTGGMAVVYKALDMKLNRYVAVKILKEEFLNDEELCRRFHKESEAVAMLSHPNIVSVLDVNSSPQMEYFVMELIDGITLKQYMQQRGRLSSKEAVHFISLILAAVGHAHSKNVIHRDIKPQNIMILRDGSLKVADFGIARLGTEQNTLTPNTFGSVHYISPEQARGEKIDGRTDIYSAGVILYEMLTGKLPYVGNSPVSVAIQHLNSEPVPLREIDADIPKALETITLKAMCGDRDYRYTDAQSMQNDIEAFKNDPNTEIVFVRPELFASDEETQRLPNLNLPGAGGVASRAVTRRAPRTVSSGERSKRLDEREDDRDDRRYASRYTGIGAGPLLAAVLAVVLLVVGVFAVYKVLVDPSGSTGALDVHAPQLVGKSMSDITSNADYALFDIRESGSEYNDEYEEGVVVSQDPAFDRMVNATGTIYVVVSRGPRGWDMDNLTTLDFRQAEIALNRKSDTFIISKQYKMDDTIPEGQIISTTPAAGEKLREGAIITLVISTGPELKKVKMPDLLTMSEQEARKALSDLKLGIGNVSGAESDQPVGTVVSQSVKLGTEIDEGTTVDFEVSIGPAAGTDPLDPNQPTDPNQPVTPNKPDPGQTIDPNQPVTKNLPISLPSSPAAFAVKVVEDGKTTIYERTHSPEDKSIVVSITSTGSHMYSVYIDGVFRGDQVIVFTD